MLGVLNCCGDIYCLSFYWVWLCVFHTAGKACVCVCVCEHTYIPAFILNVLKQHVRCVHRVYLLYHTWSQVIYGGVAGMVMGVVWFFITQEVLTPVFPKIAAW